MRRAPLLIPLAFAGCCLSVAGEGMTQGTTSSASSGSSSGTSTGNIACATTGGTRQPLQPGPCGPGTQWVGDTCVVSCEAVITASFDEYNNVCLLPDGGFGNCADGVCLAPADPDNCGGVGLVCPPPAICYPSVIGGYCGSFVDGGRFIDFSCGGAKCPASAPECVPQRGCVAPCGPCSDNQACDTADAGLGFCCNGSCEAFGSNPADCMGCGLGCSEGAVCAGSACSLPSSCPDVSGVACRFPDGGLGSCCGGRCTDSSADCEPVSTCANSQDGIPCALDDAGAGECCGSSCSDLQDSANCGGCGVSCGPDAFCLYGSCKPLLDCAKGGAKPDYYGNCLTGGGAIGSCCGPICIDLAHDPQNCGTCGSACPMGGSCVAPPGHRSTCLDGAGRQLSCSGGGSCADGTSCIPGWECLGATCDGHQTVCGVDGGIGFCCGTECAVSDDLRCGGSCPVGTFVSGSGGCALPDGGPPCGPEAICPPGTFCAPYARECVPLDACQPVFQTPGDGDCWLGASALGGCCGDVCVAFYQDPNNCGGCGLVCPSGICLSSYARIGTFWPLCLPTGPTNDCLESCPAGSVCLQGRCFDGSARGDQQRPFCLAADGTIGVTCNPGVCANPRDDPQNCGGCGYACEPGESCIAGSCTGQPGCGNGREGFFCNLDAGTSFTCCPSVGCTDTATDPRNCGYCGTACPADSNCSYGVCR